MKKILFVLLTASILLTGCYSKPEAIYKDANGNVIDFDKPAKQLITTNEDATSYTYDESIIELVEPSYRDAVLYTRNELNSDGTLFPCKFYGAGKVVFKDYEGEYPELYRYLVSSETSNVPNFTIISAESYSVDDILVVWGEMCRPNGHYMDIDKFKVIKYNDPIPTDWSTIPVQYNPYITKPESQITDNLEAQETEYVQYSTETDSGVSAAESIYDEFAYDETEYYNAESAALEGDAGYGYVIEGSDSRYLEYYELSGMAQTELRLARNEIYARHGRLFNSADLQDYFNSMDWYVGSIPADQFDESSLNDMERYNLDVIKTVEGN